MCNIVNSEELDEGITNDEFEHDAPNFLLYSALVVEYAANFLAKYSPREMSDPMRYVIPSTMISPCNVSRSVAAATVAEPSR